MDIPRLQNDFHLLIDFMEKNGFNKSKISVLKVRLRQLFQHQGEYSSYEDFFLKFIAADGLYGTNKKYKHYREAIKTIKAFNEFNHYPNRHIFNAVQQKESAYTSLTESYRRIVDTYVAQGLKEGLKKRSIYSGWTTLSNFFKHLQTNSIYIMDDVTEDVILSFFYSHDLHRGQSYCNRLRASIKICQRGGCDNLNSILSLIPKLKTSRKNYAILSDEDFAKIMTVLKESDNTTISLRDKAITTLIMLTGLRGVDIANLKLSDIDWNADRISLIQAKTSEPLVLPLLTSVGNAILEYILNERDRTAEIQNVFLNYQCSDIPLTPSAIGAIVKRIFSLCGINPPVGENGGRLFRRYVATKALRDGEPTKVISSILGHVSSDALESYLDSDLIHLKNCAIDVSQYPIRKEVFEV